ncbi:hypothetical protein MtrunA17_Chr2g0312281 [Medicago truncatula]|uniref:Uncharacterized protein n=1 Tax=Medicago truncatula TaxID=3880 RepID=A0A072VAH9_MEDTR|nr:uncharacterized protein LOC25487028 [Medicago truncatula]KEH38363.1 hypothetical protein MTR_2g069770 [Medicago truncatula]RHN74613.1 hypothetical protein MtrunA17_Chr2g0312281 [Medicago truncatula]
MASACINNNISMSPETFFPWGDPEPDFEFRLQDPVNMLPADQLFSDGKLVPLHFKPSSSSSTTTSPKKITTSITTTDPILFSPKAPRCSSRWKDLLGLKKLYNNSTNTSTTTKTMSSSNNKSFKHLLNRSCKTTSSENGSLNLPLLKDTENESLSISSRLSLSSSSSSHDHDDLPRLSLDSDKPNPISIHRNPNQNPNQNPNPRIRLVKPKSGSFDGNNNKPDHNRAGRSPIRMESSSTTQGCRGVSVDSPRLNSSGKIVFQSLERSSSSPGSFTGGPRFKHRGMERSYSANVRVTPVLNVPVCSLRGSSKSGSVFGFGQLFSSPQKRDSTVGGGNSNGNGNGKSHHHQYSVKHHQQHKHT